MYDSIMKHPNKSHHCYLFFVLTAIIFSPITVHSSPPNLPIDSIILDY